MSLSTDLLSVMLNRQSFNEISPYLKGNERLAVFSDVDRKILNMIRLFFKNTSIDDISRGDLLAFYTLNYKDDEDTSKIIRAIINKIASLDINEIPSSSFLVQKVAEQASAYEIGILINDYNNGKEIDIINAIAEVNSKYERYVNTNVNNKPVSLDVSHILDRKLNDTGFKWHLPVLRENLLSLYEGTFVVLAARPDTGKTTFMTHMATHFATQIDEVYPDEERVIYWFNNEGIGSEIQARLYQSAFRCGISGLGELQSKGILQEEYLKYQGGSQRIYVFDIHGYNTKQVEALMKKRKPAMIIIDMVDNVKFEGHTANSSGDKGHDRLEGLYQETREWSVRYRCPVIAASQLSADAEGNARPTIAMLAGSKTGKAGAADIIIMLGRAENPNFPDLRTISTPKNKRGKEGSPVVLTFNTEIKPHEGYFE